MAHQEAEPQFDIESCYLDWDMVCAYMATRSEDSFGPVETLAWQWLGARLFILEVEEY